MKVGRNDPCPCGSGRKYKNCCMRRDQLSASQRLSSNYTERVLLNSLYEFAVSSRFAPDLDASFQVYWGGNYDAAGLEQMASTSALRWLEWFTHDYGVGEDKRHPIDIYLETVGPELPDEYQDALRAMADSAMGLYRVDSIEADSLALYDLLRERDTTAQDAALARTAHRGDLLIGRLYCFEDMQHLSASTLLLPSDFEPGIVSYVQNAYENHRAQRGTDTWDGFLREYGHIFMAYLLSNRAESLRPLIGPGTAYHDPVLARDKLRELTNRLRAERQAQEQEADSPWGEERRTATGIILPGEAESEGPSESTQESPPTILIPGRDS